MPETALTVLPSNADVYMPVFQLEQAAQRRQQFVQFVAKQLKEGIDYGGMSSGGKGLPSLKKPGAEKLSTFFGLSPKFDLVEKITDWTGEEHGGQPLFSFTYDCSIYRGDYFIASASANCNSWESKYRWRWLPQDQIPRSISTDDLMRRDSVIEEFQFALEKRDTAPPYGKPPEYWDYLQGEINAGRAQRINKQTKAGKNFPAWRITGSQFRIPNPDPFDAYNTCLKMSHKRAFVAGVLIATNASDYFTQDLDDDVPSTHTSAPPPPDLDPDLGHTPPPPRNAAAPMQTINTTTPTVESNNPPDGLQDLWARMANTDTEGRIAIFEAMDRMLMDTYGQENGHKVYLDVLRKNGLEEPRQIRNLGVGRRVAADLFWAMNPVEENDPMGV